MTTRPEQTFRFGFPCRCYGVNETGSTCTHTDLCGRQQGMRFTEGGPVETLHEYMKRAMCNQCRGNIDDIEFPRASPGQQCECRGYQGDAAEPPDGVCHHTTRCRAIHGQPRSKRARRSEVLTPAGKRFLCAGCRVLEGHIEKVVEVETARARRLMEIDLGQLTMSFGDG